MKILYPTFFLVFLIFTVKAQTPSLNPSFDNTVPPSPNAASLGKFGNIPVGLSTGIPSVEVPIYTWENKNFGKSISISLNYHAGGVQVDELASNVGLGWALNAGGVISRTVRGIYDELPIDGFLYNTLPNDEFEGNGPRDYAANDRIFNRMYAGKVDSQADLFNFSFNGRTGRFILGKNNDILLLDRSKLRIEKFITNVSGNEKITKFIIFDEFGFQFEFSDYEVTTISVSGVTPPHTSAWYLSKITNPSQTDYITFEYEQYHLASIQTSRSQGEAIPLALDGTSLSANLGGNGAQSVSGKRIKTITFNDGNIANFIYNDANRSDLPANCTDKALNKIVISNDVSSYGFKLSQDYSLAGRLTLLSVQQFGATETETLKPYQFVYSTEFLPARFSSKKDHWGYPNGNSSQSLVQKEYLIVGSNSGPYSPYKEFLGGNRDTDPTLVKAGSLIKIFYPTGGYTEFDMEANVAVDNWLNRAITADIPNPFTEYQLGLSFNSTGTPGPSSNFTYNGVNNSNVQFTLSSSYINGCSGCQIKIEIFKSSQSNPAASFVMSVGSSSSSDISANFTMPGLITGQSFYTKTYLMNYSGNSGPYYGYASLSFRQQNPEGTTKSVTLGTNQLYVGGLRAKKITDYTQTGVIANLKEYKYVLEDGVTSSGSLGYRPIYSYFIKYDFRLVGNNGDSGPTYNFQPLKDYIVRSSNSVNEIPLVNGGPVTYKRVVEKNIHNGVDNGKIVRTFSSFSDSYPYISEDFPTIPAQYSSWNYGLLKSEEIYDASGVIIQKTENLHTTFSDGYSTDQNRVTNFRSLSFAPVSFNTDAYQTPKVNPAAPPGYFKMKTFTPVAGRAEISESKVTTYVSGQPAASKTTNYLYDQSNFYLTEQSTNDSRGGIIKTVFTYPNGMIALNEDATVYSGMVGLNIINPVIKETMFRNSIQTFMKKTKYRNWSGSLYAPERVITKGYDNAEEVRLRYLQYDIHGAPVSVQKEGGPISTYLWSYGGSKLIGVIENSGNYATLSGSLGDIESFRNLKNPSSAQLDAFLMPVSDSHLNRYKYNTLSGVTTTTDIKGLTTNYEYDGFLRLKSITDSKNNIVKLIDYQIKP